MENILFIGGAGFIGASIIREMIAQGMEQKGIFVIEPTLADVSRLDGLQVNLQRGKLSEIDLLETIICANGINKVIHLVSSMVPGCGYDEYKQEFEDVLFPTVRLMQLCSRLGVQFVYFSSGGTVYGERKTLVPFVETDPKEPISYYGLSKQMIENSILFEHRMSNLCYLILRPSNPYGHGQKLHGRQGLIAVALGKILSGETMTVWGDGSSIRDYVYIDDLAKVVTQLLRKNVCNTVVNIGSSKGYSVRQVLDVINKVVGKELKVVYTHSRKTDVSNMILDISWLKKLVDVEITPLEEGVRLFYQYEKERLNSK